VRARLLFAGVVCWEGAAALLFWGAPLRFRLRRLALWAAFLIAYTVEGTHLRLFTAHLVTLLPGGPD
jgi:hypothetical protein